MSFFKKLFSKPEPQKDIKADKPVNAPKKKLDIQTVLNSAEKPEVLLKVRTVITQDKNINVQNAFNTAKIDEPLRQEILNHYVWQTLGDLDTNLNCTMQLVRIDVQDKYKPEIEGEMVYQNLFKLIDKMD